MNEVMQSVGVHIIRFLSDSDLETISTVNQIFKDLAESALLWRSLLASFNPKSNKDSVKPVRVRTVKQRPAPKFRSNNAPEPIHSKQWIFIPPDLTSQLKVITINKAAQLRKNEDFKASCFQVLEAWTESISRTINILETQEVRGELEDPYSAVVFWKDKVRIIEDLLEELSDVCVAKIDAVFAGTKPHKAFVNQIEKVKKHYREAKAVWGDFVKVEGCLKDLNKLQSIENSVKAIIVFLEDRKGEKDWKVRIDVIFQSLLKKFFQALDTEADLNLIFRNADFQLLTTIRSICGAIISSSFVNNSENQRPSTSYMKPPASINENHLNVLLHIVNVCNDISLMLEKTCNNELTDSIIKIYTEVPVEFKIWKHENQVFWARLVRGFLDRIKIKQYVLVSDNEDLEDNDELVVTKWSVS